MRSEASAPRKYACAGTESEDYLAMIHTEIPVEKVFGIPGAKAAVDKEWDKLFRIESFDLDRVMAHKDIVAMYAKVGKPVRFGLLRTVCNDKGSELERRIIQEGRVVFR